ncbi:MAG: lipase family alpha/beta hydrolase, partial [Hyphomicrobiaceae bacterium]
ADGYDTYVHELPKLGLGDIAETAKSLVAFVDRILAATGARRVDLIAHSQGGLIARYYVKKLGGRTKVDSLISLGAPHYGTELNVSGLCRSCGQMLVGSRFLNELNAGDDTIGSVDYTNIYTRTDLIVFPFKNSQLRNGAANVLVQSQCFFRFVSHAGLIFDGAVYSGVKDALRHRPITLDCWAI